MKLHLSTSIPTWFSSVLITGIFFLAVLTGIEPVFLINDNYGIIYNLENGFVSPFIGYMWSNFLILLYWLMNGSVSWYGVSLYICHFISVLLFIESLFRMKLLRMVLVPTIVLYLTIYFMFLLKVDYSGASIMIGANSLLFFIIYLKGNHSRIFLPLFMLLGCLFALSYQIRTAGIVLVVLIIFPVFFVIFYQEVEKKYKAIFLFLLPVLISIPTDFICESVFASKEYAEYHSFVRLIGKFYGYDVQLEPAILQKNGWTEIDFQMFANFFFPNEQKFNTETIKNLTNGYVAQKVSEQLVFSKLTWWFTSYQYYIFLCALPLFFLILQGKFHRFQIAFLYFSYSVIIMMLMVIYLRFPERIGEPAFLLVYALILYIGFFEAPEQEKTNEGFQPKKAKVSNSPLKLIYTKVVYLSFGMSIVTMVLYRFSYIEKTMESMAVQKNHSDSYIYQLESLGKDSVFLIEPFSSVIIDGFNALERIHGNQTKLKMVHFGWLTYSPVFYSSLTDYLKVNNAHDIFPKIFNNPNFYLVVNYDEPTGLVFTTDQKNYQRANLGILILSYLQNTYQLPVELAGAALYPKENGIAAFRLVTTNPIK